jgi:polyvinyl alcohol dehydrogenase (cytochrome)
VAKHPDRIIRRALTAAGAAGALIVAGLASGSATQAQPASRIPAQSASDWTSYLHDGSHSSYNPGATSITPGNIGSLEPVWRWIVPPSPNTGTTLLQATPTVSDGVAYIGAEDGYFYAVSEATQQVLWSDFLGLVTPTTCPGTWGVTSTATVADDPVTGNPTVYVNAPDGHLDALDAATGTLLWQGTVGIPSTKRNNYYAWGSPLVTDGNVYIGVSSECDNPLVPGAVLAFNQSTGTQAGVWHALPTGDIGASVWSSPGITADGRIIATTGNGYPNTGQPANDQSIVALDPNTLSLLDSWEVPPSQSIKDGDFGGSPTMFTATINGVSTNMVGACNKDGIYYAFNSDDLAAGPVWQTTISQPYAGGAAECVAAAIWDGTNLIEGGGGPTTINGVSYMGSVQDLNPATGVPVWQTGLPGTVVGSPSEDGAGVVAAPTYQAANGQTGVYLLSAATGAILDFIPVPHSPLFGQPVFDGQDLLIGGGAKAGLTAYDITTSGGPITVSPATIGQGTTETLQITGSGFTGTPSVFISGVNVTPGTVTVVSPTTLDVQVTVTNNAGQTARDVTVTEPGSPPVAYTCPGCLSIGPKPPAPAPASLNPNSFTAGSKNVSAVLTGANFDPTAEVVTAGGMYAKTTYVNSTTLDVKLTVQASKAPGSYNLWVKNTDDGLQGKCAGCVTVTAGP